MLIKNFGRYDVKEGDDNNSMGIIGRKRNIYVFVSDEEYKNCSYLKAKACIENIVVHDSDHAMSQAIKIPGSKIIRSAVYFGDIITTIPGNIRDNYAMFVMDNCSTTERMMLPNGEQVTFSPGTWSKRLYQMDDADFADFIGISGYTNEIMNLSPEYYTAFHMFAKTGDFMDLRYENVFKIPMSKLIDCHTSIIYMNILKYDTIRLEAFKQIPKTEAVCKGSFDVSNGLKSSFNSFVGQGSTFIYDSDALGFGKSGANVRGGYIPFGKQYHPKYLMDNLNNTIEQFKTECHELESKYGHIKIHYNPSNLSDKLKVEFKDFKKSPIITPSQVNNDGSVNINLSNTSPLSSIDNGYVTDSYVKDMLNLQWQNTQNNFQQEMFIR